MGGPRDVGHPGTRDVPRKGQDVSREGVCATYVHLLVSRKGSVFSYDSSPHTEQVTPIGSLR